MICYVIVKICLISYKQRQKRDEKIILQIIDTFISFIDAKDPYTKGHSQRVAIYTKEIARRMGLDADEIRNYFYIALMHDCGKLLVPDSILKKPDALTPEERKRIEEHTVIGADLLKNMTAINGIQDGALQHHERYDGKGYPNGLAGDKIPEMARILGVADSYDAMTSNRSYRDGLPQEVVRNEIIKGRGTQFDPEIADIMLQLMEEDKDYQMRQIDSLQRKILVVDDEPMNHKLLKHIMSDEPMYEINAVNGGAEALKELNHQQYDLIMLDVMMPDMDGLETLRNIRKIYNTPVVLMTGNKTLDTSVGFAELGCNDYITKPFLPLLIKEVVHNMTERGAKQ